MMISQNDVGSIAVSPQGRFYSQLSKVMQNAPDKVFGQAAQVKAWLLSNAGKLGVKLDEIQWSGITDWLDLQEGKVTKAQIADYLIANGVQVSETMLGDTSHDRMAARMVAANAFEKRGYTLDFDGFDDEGAFYTDENGDDVEYDDLPDDLKEVIDAASRDEAAGIDGDVKYSKYVVNGGENYKELLLTLPRKFTPKEYTFSQAVSEMESFQNPVVLKSNGIFVKNITEIWQLVDNKKDIDSGKYTIHQYDFGAGHMFGEEKQFKSSHWEQPNILAHIRFDERTDADGKKVLFINEIQSDWGQKGKKEGFAKPVEKLNETSMRVKMIDTPYVSNSGERFEYGVYQGSDLISGHFSSSAIAHEELARLAGTSIKIEGVPKAPFVGKTDAWVSLAIKRMIRYAADNGFDKVAFISGEQAADLYDLSKQVDVIEVSPLRNGKVGVTASNNNSHIFSKEVTVDELPDIVGKELASKIVKDLDESPRGNKAYSGIDLKVGGEGMHYFYDNLVPKVAKDIVKKLGGSVEIMPVGNQDNIGEAHARKMLGESANPNVKPQLGFTITPAMRAKILNEGIPLFSKNQQTADQGLSLFAIDTEIDRLRKQWPAIPKVTVAKSVKELPFDAPVNADGAYHNGHVYVVANNISDLKQLQKVMAHECVLHHSLQEMLGDYGFSKLHSGIQALKLAGDPVVMALAANILGRYGVLPPESETKEIIARAGEQCLDKDGNVRVEYGFMKSVFAGVAGWLRDHGFKVPFTNVELQGIMHDAGEWIQRDVGHERDLGGGMSPAFSQGDAGIEIASTPIDKNQTVIMVDGVERSAQNSIGQPIHWSEEGVRNFWRGFENSKVVDANGLPLVVFHGTNADISTFNISERGSFGGGIYFADEKAASQYAQADNGQVYSVYLNINNPLVFNADFNRGEEIDFDTAAIPMVEMLFSSTEAAEIIAKSKNSDGFFGKEIQAAAENKGYDGIIAVYEDGSKEYIGFNPNQIKSAIGNEGVFSRDVDNILFSHQDIVVSGSFSGRVLDVADGVMVQKIGRDPDTIVRHDVARLSAAVKVGDVVDIKYRDGVGEVSGKVISIER